MYFCFVSDPFFLIIVGRGKFPPKKFLVAFNLVLKNSLK